MLIRKKKKRELKRKDKEIRNRKHKRYPRIEREKKG